MDPDLDRARSARLAGAKQIEEHCLKLAQKLGLELESAIWSTDVATLLEEYLLILITRSGSSAIRFSRDELEHYAGGPGIDQTNARILQELRRFCY